MVRMRFSPLLACAFALALCLATASPCLAEEPAGMASAPAPAGPSSAELKVMADTVWVMVTGMLVFFMNLGFGCVESGFCRAKNAVNILSKNFVVFAAASIAFWVAGFGLMFGDGSKYIGTKGVMFVSGGADKEIFSADVAVAALKDEIKTKGKIDLTDAETAKKEKTLADAVAAQAAAAAEKIKGSDDTYTAKLTVGTTTIEKAFTGSDYYWNPYPSLDWTSVPLWAKFFFQLVFAGTAATIVSGAVAERIKYGSFVIFSFLLTLFIYPVVGHWIWGGGLLSAGAENLFGADKGMFDFAGSTVVHSVGGWAALAGAIILGPRLGKYGPDGKTNAIPGHNMTAAFIGCLVLWFGWFGFNPGSTMAADPGAISRVAVTTNTAAAFATLTATITAWLLLGKPDIGMTLNGCLAGLVAITAPCGYVTAGGAAIIGAVAGVLVVLSVLMFDRIRVDDPVGATSVHLVNGIWGTIAVGLFGYKELIVNGVKVSSGLANDGFLVSGSMAQLIPQVTGVLLVGLYTFPVALGFWLIIKFTIGARVSPEEEIEGLDIGEHGNEAYHGFVMASATDHPYPPIEPRSALVPPNGGKRFRAVVDGVPSKELNEVWSNLCQPQPSGPSEEFKAVYPFVTTIQGNTFRFRGGDPEAIRSNLERLLKGQTNGHPVKVRVEA
jgi:ammonium transporter, Amt family